MDFATLPKIELHLHLDCSLSYAAVSRYESGVSVGVNTDTRMIANVTLTQEYEKLHEAFGWDERHFLNCNLNALEAAFLPEEVKRRLEKQVRAGYEA
jgi:adenosine deaminase